MEENTEVEMDGKRYVWDGDSWAEAKTWISPPDAIINKLNQLYRKEEAAAAIAAKNAPKPRAPRQPRAKFVPRAQATQAPPPPPPKPVERITAYEGENAFLSNDAPATVHLDGQAFPSIALAFDAAKQLHDRLRLGMQREWEEEKRVPLMKRLLRSKFAHPQLRAALLATGEKHLSHQAADADPFWHAPGGEGENTLGKLLMALRAQMNKHYCRLSDDEIVEHLKEFLVENPVVPDEALVRDCCWSRITELCELYKGDLSPEIGEMLRARREQAMTPAAPASAEGSGNPPSPTN